MIESRSLYSRCNHDQNSAVFLQIVTGHPEILLNYCLPIGILPSNTIFVSDCKLLNKLSMEIVPLTILWERTALKMVNRIHYIPLSWLMPFLSYSQEVILDYEDVCNLAGANDSSVMSMTPETHAGMTSSILKHGTKSTSAFKSSSPKTPKSVQIAV